MSVILPSNPFVRPISPMEEKEGNHSSVILSAELMSWASGTAEGDLSKLKELNMHVRERSFPKVTHLANLQ